MDFTKFFAKIANRRRSSIIRKWAKAHMTKPNSITLANGLPNAELFPFESISVTYKGIPEKKFTGKELSSALQYGATEGHLPLLQKIREFQEKWHKPQYDQWQLYISSGSQDGCSKVMEMLIDIGDAVMVQTPAFTGAINAIVPFAPEFIEIGQDQDGIIPEEIENVCAQRMQDKKPMPKLLYVNPTGANPTGTVLPEDRRRKVYELAKKYDFLIIEDDPYYFIHFTDKNLTSFFKLDTEGRVIRLDSFSKFLSAGIRMGVVTGHKELISKLLVHVESSLIHSSALSQMFIYKLFDAWGLDKFDEHFENIRKFYYNKRNIMLAGLEKHLTGLAEWNVPKGGMFCWVKIKGLADVLPLATDQCVSNGIFVLPGQAFYYDLTKESQYLRLCYSYATAEDIDKALSIVAKLIREEVSKKGN